MTTTKLTPAQVKAGNIIGLKIRNKNKIYCIRGHLLPRYKTNGRRTCEYCIKINYDPEKHSEYQHTNWVKTQKVKDSKFPMVTRLQVKGIKI